MESYLFNARNDKPSPPSEIVSDRPLERLIFGVAMKKTQTEKISSCYLDEVKAWRKVVIVTTSLLYNR